MQNTKTSKLELEMYTMNLYNDPRAKFNPIRSIRKFIGSFFKHEYAMKDHWSNCEDEFELRMKYYYRLIVEMMEDCNVAKVPKDLKDNGKFLEPIYITKEI